MPSKADIRALKRIAESRDVGAALAAYLSRFKARKSPSAHAASKRQKRLGGNGETARIRSECLERSGGFCECGCGRYLGVTPTSIPELDHFMGRAREESVETCWVLTRWCHHCKTENSPSREWWDRRFNDHCAKHGYPFRERLLKGAVVAQPPKETGVNNG